MVQVAPVGWEGILASVAPEVASLVVILVAAVQVVQEGTQGRLAMRVVQVPLDCLAQLPAQIYFFQPSSLHQAAVVNHPVMNPARRTRVAQSGFGFHFIVSSTTTS